MEAKEIIQLLKETRNPETKDDVKRFDDSLVAYTKLTLETQNQELENLFEVFHNDGHIHLMMSLVHFVESYPHYLKILTKMTGSLELQASDWLVELYQRFINGVLLNREDVHELHQALSDLSPIARKNVLSFLNGTFKAQIYEFKDETYIREISFVIDKIIGTY
jgi:hypothetical protein